MVMPEWKVSQWFNTAAPLRQKDLLGRVVLLHAFQMLCPGCVEHGLPQTARAHAALAEMGLVVIGLHTVFEDHAEMQPPALEAFVREQGLLFPIGVDQGEPDSAIPLTMQRLGLQGTPTTLLLDRAGRIRLHVFGALDDLRLGVAIGQLLAETETS